MPYWSLFPLGRPPLYVRIKCEKLNGFLALKSLPLPALNAVVLTKPGAVRPVEDHLFPAFLPGLRHETT